MDGEGFRNEKNNHYIPARPEHLLCAFVKNWFGPKGRSGDGQTWRCGLMATALSYLMSASQVPHRVIGGRVEYIQSDGKKFSAGHIWIECDKDYFKEGESAVEIYDPSRNQFQHDATLEYIKEKTWNAVQFLPLIFQQAPEKVQEFFISKDASEGLALSFLVHDEFPALEYKLEKNQAIELAEASLHMMGIRPAPPIIQDGVILEAPEPHSAPEKLVASA